MTNNIYSVIVRTNDSSIEVFTFTSHKRAIEFHKSLPIQTWAKVQETPPNLTLDERNQLNRLRGNDPIDLHPWRG
jgi:hypothetical protein